MRKSILMALLAACLCAASWAQDGLGDIFAETPAEDGSESGKAGIDFNGDAGVDLLYYLDEGTESAVEPAVTTNLTLAVKEKKAEATIVLSVTEDFKGNILTFDDIIDTASIRFFLPFGFLEAGLLKTEWGKGDGIHAVDPLNPLDQSSGVKDDLDSMKTAVPMAKFRWSMTDQSSLELVYVPFFTPMAFAADGRWAVADYSMLPPLQPAPDTKTLENFQAGARLTATLGAFDLGASYYYGYYAQPGLRIFMTTDIVYTRAQLIAAEAAVAAGPFTIMAEGGYWLSEDGEGADAALYNSKVVYLAGIDYTVPGTELFLSVQLNGSWIQDFDDANPVDVDFMQAQDGKAFSNAIVAAADWPFLKEKLRLRLAGTYAIEARGYALLPSFSWKMTDNLELAVKAKIFGGEDVSGSVYRLWDENDSIGISLKYQF